MEHELRALRTQLVEKSKHSMKLQKEVRKLNMIEWNQNKITELRIEEPNSSHEALQLEAVPNPNDSPDTKGNPTSRLKQDKLGLEALAGIQPLHSIQAHPTN